MTKKSLAALSNQDLAGKHVFVRVDFNVPMDKNDGSIADDTRIRKGVPTIQHLRDMGAKVVLGSHMGRPKPDKSNEGLHMSPVSVHLSSLLGAPVQQAASCVGPEVQALAKGMQPGEVLMLENLRFHPEETSNDDAFCQQLAESSCAQVYVNDAFGTAHRAHASTEGVVKHIQGPHVAGFLMGKELEFLSGAIDQPKKPFAALVGGAKVSTKIAVLESLLTKVDKLVLGGAMIFTFLKAKGLSVGASMVEEESLELAKALMLKAEQQGVQLILPVDVVVAEEFAEDANFKVVPVSEIPDDWFGLDIGPASLEAVETALGSCQTILWNGPMGVFEWPRFSNGTFGVARAMAARTSAGAVTIVGGGDSVSAVEKCGLSDQMSHISTGGGASLELLEGRELPGVAALDDA